MRSLWEILLWEVSKVERLRFWYLARQRGPWLFYLFLGLNSAVAIFVLGFFAKITSWPLIFPSLGPTLLLAFYAPDKAIAAPKNALLGHLLGGGIGWLCYTLLARGGLAGAEINYALVAGAAFTLGLAGALMLSFKILHPPAASTALLAALGYLSSPFQFLGLILALVLVLLQCKLMHSLAGIPYPWWSPPREEEPELAVRGFTLFPKRAPRDLNELGELLISKGKINQKD